MSRFPGHPYISVDYLQHLADRPIFKRAYPGTKRGELPGLLIQAGLAERTDRHGELHMLGEAAAPTTAGELTELVGAAYAALRLKFADGNSKVWIAASEPYPDPRNPNRYLVHVEQQGGTAVVVLTKDQAAVVKRGASFEVSGP